MPRLLAVGSAAAASALLAYRWWDDIVLAGIVAKYSAMIWLVDNLPEPKRREILSQEYEGEALEKRLGQRIFTGLSTVRALWRMSRVNLRPRVAVGDVAPATRVLLGGIEVFLPSLARGKRPLLLNFGSCT